MNSTRNQRVCSYRPVRRCRLGGLETLEDRRLLAVVSWDGGGDGVSWQDQLNWSSDLLPSAADDVLINSPGTVITLSSGVHTINSLDSEEPILINGGTLSIADASEAPQLDYQGGALELNGTLTVLNQFNWIGGGLSGSGELSLAAGSTNTIGNGLKQLTDVTLTNGGDLARTGGNALRLTNATINNLSGATFEITSDDRIDGDGGVFNNDGTFIKSGGAGELTIAGTGAGDILVFNNNGSLDVQSGEVTFEGGTRGAHDGSFTAQAGTELQIFAGGGSLGGHALSATSSVTGVGDATVKLFGFVTVEGAYDVDPVDGSSDLGFGPVVFNTTITNIGSSVSIQGGQGPVDLQANVVSASNLTVIGGSLELDGTFTVTDQFDWTTGGGIQGNGELLLAAGSTNTIGSGLKQLTDVTLTNGGDLARTGGNALRLTNATINNLSGATFEITSDDRIDGDGGVFNNDGTFIKSGGAGELTIAGTGAGDILVFNNNGSLDVQSGEVTFEGGTRGAHDGSFTAQAGTELQIFAGGGSLGGHALSATSSVTGVGDATVKLFGFVTVEGAYDVDPVDGSSDLGFGPVVFNTTITNIGSSVSIQGGQGPVDLQANVVSANNLTVIGGSLELDGTFTVTDQFDWTTGGGIQGNGELLLAAGSTNTIGSGLKQLTDVTLTNGGDLARTGGNALRLTNATINNLTGATFEITSDDRIDGDGGVFNNDGTFIKSGGAGELLLIGTGAGDVLTIVNRGSWQSISGTTRFSSPYTQQNGETRLAGGDFANSNPLQILDGVVTGTGSVMGDVNNTGGTLSPGQAVGAIGQLTIQGSYVQGSAADLELDISTSSSDLIQTTGLVTLDGDLNLQLIGTPATGSTFTLLDNQGLSAIVGEFTGLPEGATFVAGSVGFEITYAGGDGNDIVLTTISLNQPPVISAQTLSIVENSPVGSSAGFVTASDPDVGDMLAFNTIGGTGQAFFDVDSMTGEVTVVDDSVLDFETTSSFTLDVEVVDTSGLSANAVITVSVLDQNEAPAIDSVSIDSAVDENDFANLSVSFIDEDLADIHVVQIDWGDGTVETITLAVGDRSLNLSHQYLDDDPSGTGSDVSDIEITVTDSGGEFDTASATTVVNNVAPVITSLNGPSQAVRGELIELLGSFTDQGTLDTHTISWEVTGPDATVVATSASLQLDFTPIELGTYAAVLTITDDDGGVTNQAFNVDVGLALVRPKASDPTKNELVIAGSDLDEKILVNVDDADPNTTIVSIEERTSGVVTQLSFTDAIDCIHILAEGGDDFVAISSQITAAGTVFGGDGDDLVFGGSGADQLFGEAGDDFLLGRRGDDTLFGGLGNDRLKGHRGADLLYGNEGDDKLAGGRDADELHGGPGHDIMWGQVGEDLLYGGDGDDILFGGNGDDTLYGDDGDDWLNGGNGNDTIYGGDGNDVLFGGYGDDMMFGDDGSDLLFGGAGDDVMSGGDGDDFLFGGPGADQLDGGDGMDVVFQSWGWVWC